MSSEPRRLPHAARWSSVAPQLCVEWSRLGRRADKPSVRPVRGNEIAHCRQSQTNVCVHKLGYACEGQLLVHDYAERRWSVLFVMYEPKGRVKRVWIGS